MQNINDRLLYSELESKKIKMMMMMMMMKMLKRKNLAFFFQFLSFEFQLLILLHPPVRKDQSLQVSLEENMTNVCAFNSYDPHFSSYFLII